MEAFIDGIHKDGDQAIAGGRNFANDGIDATKSTATRVISNTDGVRAGESAEGAITKQIEKATSKIPSATFLTLALAAVALSAGLRIFGRKDDAQFVGHWVPTILTLGLYNKLVKLEGSE